MSNETTFPGLIRDYAEAGRIDLIITLCESMKEQRDRAERRIDILTHNIAKLNESFRNITEPATGRKITDPAPASISKDSKQKRHTEARSSPAKKDGPDVSDFQF